DSSGRVSEQTVRRHLAKIKLVVKNTSDDARFRPRFLEVPVLYNTKSKAIEMCNNEINIGDACQAMGYRWDVGSVPPQCVMTSACLYGGAYTARRLGTCGPGDINPATGDCSCPAGY